MQRANCSRASLVTVQGRIPPSQQALGGVVAVAQVPAQLDDVAVGRGDEPFERVAVSSLGVEQESGQVVHGAISLGRELRTA